MTHEKTRIVFVSGLSGSGRTTAMGALEDLGFYGVDNIPPQLIEQFVDLCAKATPPVRDIALALDAREAAFLKGFPAVVQAIRATGARADVLFLDCADEVLVSRYRETRRVHPLAPAGTVEQGTLRERALLEDVARLADHVLDTSRLNIHQLRDAVVRWVTGEGKPSVVTFVSFGYRYGVPAAAELLFDVRFLPNPHFEPLLRPKTGLDQDVADYVLGHAAHARTALEAGGVPRLPARALRRRGQGLSDGRDRLHRGSPSLGGGGDGGGRAVAPGRA